MRRLFIFCALLAISYSFIAQNITNAEYFIDTDPGFGNATAIPLTPDTIIDLNFTANLSAVSNGVHALYVRSKDSGAAWGLTFVRTFIKNTGMVNPSIVSAEYFIDSLPALGSGTPIPISSSDTVNLNFVVDISNIDNGIHILYVACRDTTGARSLAFERTFIKSTGTGTKPAIVSAEYFIDSLPALGSGTPIPLSPSDTVNLNFVVDISNVDNGIHILYIACRDTAGARSLAFERTFIKSTSIHPEAITSIEFSVDSFNGYGNGQKITIISDTMVDFNGMADLYSVPKGVHTIYWRSIDAAGHVSQSFLDTFCLRPDALFSTDTACLGSASHFTDHSFNADNSTYYYWDFGDGTSDSTANPQHTYSSWGNYTACLYLNDICNDSICHNIKVDTIPLAAFSAIDSELTVHFYDQSIDAQSWNWDFGDGQSSDLKNPVHTYSTSDMYTVTLTIQNHCGIDSITHTYFFVHTGFDNPDQQNNFSLYPNPADSYLNLNWAGMTRETVIYLLNPLGIVIQQFKLSTKYGNLHLDINELPTGCYLIRIQNNLINRSLKWIKN